MFSDSQTRKDLIDELIGSSVPSSKSLLPSMAKDPYGSECSFFYR